MKRKMKKNQPLQKETKKYNKDRKIKGEAIMKKEKAINLIVIFVILWQTIGMIIPKGVLAIEESKTKKELQIEKEKEWVLTQDDDRIVAKWTFKDKTIRISGQGKMYDWHQYYYNAKDWHETGYDKLVEKVIIEEGITNLGNYIFNECINLKEVIIPKGLTYIGDNCFRKCNQLTQIKVDSNNEVYKDIDGVLYKKDNTELIKYPCQKQSENITIPEEVTNIKEQAFQGAKYLTEINIPSKVTRIGISAFEGCSKIKKITIPEGVTEIGEDTFKGCENIEQIDVPSEVNKIGRGAFEGCSKLTTILLPQNITKIEGNTFSLCTNLTEITIPTGVTSIERYAFYQCEKLTKISIPIGVIEIGEFSFGTCKNLSNISLPSTLTKLGNCAFSDCEKLEKVEIPQGVTEIKRTCFYQCSNLTEITIPDTVTSIGDSSFKGCYSLTLIKLPENLTYLGERAFDNCTNLTEITIPKKITELKNSIFNDCINLKKVTILGDITSIGNSAFDYCTSLSEINLPKTMKKIGKYAFDQCTNLTEITIPEGVTEIGEEIVDRTILKVTADSKAHEYAENNQKCYKLEGTATKITTNYQMKSEKTWDISENEDNSVIAKLDLSTGTLRITGQGKVSGHRRYWKYTAYQNAINKVIIEKGITEIGDLTFYECKNIKEVSIPEGVTKIGYLAFDECNSIEEIRIPKTVESINESFGGELLKQIKVDVNNEYYKDIDGVLYNKNATTLIRYPANKENDQIIIPEGVTTIGARAFFKCNKLAQITIPKSVQKIGQTAFSHCTNLKSINLPESITRIEADTFYNCNNLIKLSIPEKVTEIEGSAFAYCSKLSEINLPQGIRAIERATFKNCEKLTNLVIPEGVTIIQSEAFGNNKSLTHINLPEKLTELSDRAFSQCENLTEITIPKGIKTIEGSTFSECYHLVKVTLPEELTTIESYAFEDCTNLTEITIPEKVTNIGYSAFRGCSKLTEINLPDNLSSIDDYVFAYTKIKKIKIPSKVTEIKTYTFYACNNLEQIIIPKEVQTLEEGFAGPYVILWCQSNSAAHTYAQTYGQPYILDDEGPTIEISPNGIETKQRIQNITIQTTDEMVGIQEGSIKYTWSNQNTIEPPEENYITIEENAQITKSLEEGNNYLWIKAKDKLGNETKIISRPFMLDTTAPKLEITYNPDRQTKETVEVTITANEEIQEIEGWKRSENHKELTKQYTENTQEEIEVKDLVGNSSKITITVNQIEKTKYILTSDGYIMGIKTNTKVEDFKRKTAEQLGKQVEIQGSETMIKTGMIATEGGKSYILVVKGDISKDGKCDLIDLSALILHLAEDPIYKLTGAKEKAGDLNLDQTTDIIDLSNLCYQLAN